MANTVGAPSVTSLQFHFLSSSLEDTAFLIVLYSLTFQKLLRIHEQRTVVFARSQT